MSVTSDQLKAVLADFELKVSVSDIVRDADLDGNGTLELNEFRAMIAETPDPKMLSGAFRIGTHQATTAEEPFYYGGSSPTKVEMILLQRLLLLLLLLLLSLFLWLV